MLAFAAALALLSCPEPRKVRIDLDVWARELRAATSATSVDSLLGKLQLAPPLSPARLLQEEGRVGKRGAALPDCGSDLVRVLGVDLFDANLSGGHRKETIVQVRLDVCPSDAWGHAVSLRVQVLQPAGDGLYCALGGDLGFDRLVRDFRCEADQAKPAPLPRTIAFVHLTHAKRNTVEAHDLLGACEDGEAQHWLSFWNVDEGSLHKIFEAELAGTRGQPHSNTLVRAAALRRRGRFPKELVLSVRETLSGCHGDECFSTPTKTIQWFRYDGTRYVEVEIPEGNGPSKE